MELLKNIWIFAGCFFGIAIIIAIASVMIEEIQKIMYSKQARKIEMLKDMNKTCSSFVEYMAELERLEKKYKDEEDKK